MKNQPILNFNNISFPAAYELGKVKLKSIRKLLSGACCLLFILLFQGEICIAEQPKDISSDKPHIAMIEEDTSKAKKQKSCRNELNNFFEGQKLDEDSIQIAAVFPEIIEEQYCKGILEALRAKANERKVNIVLLSYAGEDAGVLRLKEIFSGKESGDGDTKPYDIIIGPTDSGVFVKARDNFDEWTRGRKKIPVISPLVTGAGVTDPKGWFFQLNVNVERRAQEMAYFMAKHLLRSIAILYADTTFGQMSEEAFRKKFTELRPNTGYLPLQYTTLNQKDDPSSLVFQVIKSRSDAVGIFGTRDDIIKVSKLLKTTNPYITPYNPLLFTILDARRTSNSIDELYMLSVVNYSSAQQDENKESPKKTDQNLDDVQALTHDTTVLVLDALDSNKAWETMQPELFREKISNILKGALATSSQNKTKTNIKFKNYANEAELYIFLTGRETASPVLIDKNPNFANKLSMKFSLLYRVYFYWPYFNIAVITFIVVLFTYLDLRKWYKGPRIETFNLYSMLLISMNILLALVLFIYLAETRKINYDNIILALIIGMAPATLLRTTFFETETGKAVGLANHYNSLLEWINENLRNKKFKYRQAVINVITYFNCLDNMIDKLFQLYDNAKDIQTRESLKKELKDEIENTSNFIAKKRVCAEKLLASLGWETLRDLGFAADENYKVDKPIDPDIMITIARDHIKEMEKPKRQEKEKKLDDFIREELDKIHKDKATQGDAKNYDYLILEEWDVAQKNIFTKILFLVRYFNYTAIMLKKEGFLPDKWKQKAEKEFRKRNESRRKKFDEDELLRNDSE